MLIVAAACAALPTTAAGHDPGCNGRGLPLGIYDNWLDPARFDIGFNPSDAWARSEVVVSEIICGTDDESGRFHTQTRIQFPGEGERWTCARPSPPVVLCDQDGDGAVDSTENIANGSYVGSAIGDLWCAGSACASTGTGIQADDVRMEMYVSDATTGNSHCAADHADHSTVACFELRVWWGFGTGPTGGVSSSADIVIERQRASPYSLTIYQPDFDGVDPDGILEPLYIDTWDEIRFCKLAGAVKSDSCGARVHQHVPIPVALFTNGTATSFKAMLHAKFDGGTDQDAVSYGSWY